ncbi:MAG: glycosyltransferase family A protein [Gammaproteobacteria bacterium]
MIDTPSLSVVLVAFEMKRELPRTLLSLSKGYQKTHDPLRVEVIVVDNGSEEPVRPEDFAKLNIDLRVLKCRTKSESPVFAINEGIERAQNELIGVWIDGARLASPGLLQACSSASRLSPRPVIATLNWQLGPQLQYLSVEKGYDQTEEDKLLDSIRWPEQPYRLFDISTPEVKGGAHGPLLESNALFMPRSLWHELGGYDPAFDEPGGGAANPDALQRALNLPNTELIRIVGEGTFHQYHDGITTSHLGQAMETVKRAGAKYYKLRGRSLCHIRKTGILFDARNESVINCMTE